MTDTSGAPLQAEPLATVKGAPLLETPKDLYIPPDALEIILDSFEGPLDLLLYLIRRENIDILDIPVAHITEQYMSYITVMKEMSFELAAEYLLMAALLAEIKSRMLLPKQQIDGDELADPRAELVRRLQEYERYKQAAEDIDNLPRLERDCHLTHVEPAPLPEAQQLPDVELKELMLAFADVLSRAEMFTSHQIQRETLSVRERMSRVLDILQNGKVRPFAQLFNEEEGRMGVVVSFLAVLELVKEKLIRVVQQENYTDIYVQAGAEEA